MECDVVSCVVSCFEIFRVVGKCVGVKKKVINLNEQMTNTIDYRESFTFLPKSRMLPARHLLLPFTVVYESNYTQLILSYCICRLFFYTPCILNIKTKWKLLRTFVRTIWESLSLLVARAKIISTDEISVPTSIATEKR